MGKSRAEPQQRILELRERDLVNQLKLAFRKMEDLYLQAKLICWIVSSEANNSSIGLPLDASKAFEDWRGAITEHSQQIQLKIEKLISELIAFHKDNRPSVN
jgi:hypothetical protein